MSQLDRIEKLLSDVLAEIREHRHEAWKWKFNAAIDQLDDAIQRTVNVPKEPSSNLDS